MVLTWTSNSMKSIGNWAAELKERMEFSLMDFILLSDDCNMFIPLPLCPITTNLGHLNPHLVSTPSFTPTHKTQNHSFHFISKLKYLIDSNFWPCADHGALIRANAALISETCSRRGTSETCTASRVAPAILSCKFANCKLWNSKEMSGKLEHRKLGASMDSVIARYLNPTCTMPICHCQLIWSRNN